MGGKRTLRIHLRKDNEDRYHEGRAKFDDDRHFLASVMGFAIGCEMLMKFPYSNILDVT